YNLASSYDFGWSGLEKDVTRAVELYERAAELGVKEAHYSLGCIYHEGTDVEYVEYVEEDNAKAIQHYEAAAMRGHVCARFNLGNEEGRAGNLDLALQHYLIAAKMGLEVSLSTVRRMFMNGLATKADYAAALRGYQSAVEEMSSPDRDEAKASGLISSCNSYIVLVLHSKLPNVEPLPKRTAPRSPGGPPRPSGTLHSSYGPLSLSHQLESTAPFSSVLLYRSVYRSVIDAALCKGLVGRVNRDISTPPQELLEPKLHGSSCYAEVILAETRLVGTKVLV
ncbi:hypothetical protein THAOC_12891, partial [Thalassiosira oceanica]